MATVDHIGMFAVAVDREMRIIGGEVAMFMRDHVGVVRGPYTDGDEGADRSKNGHRTERRLHSDASAELADERIADQPADVAECELCREQCGAIIGVRRPT